MTEPLLRIGTRGSALALAQTAQVAAALAASEAALAAPGAIATVPIRTTGERISLASLLLLGGLYRLCRLMRLFEIGEFFSVAATRHLRAFALSLIGAVVVDALVPPLLMLGLGLAGSANVQAISLQLDGSDLWTLLIGAMFFVITSLMVEARQLAEDNEQIV